MVYEIDFSVVNNVKKENVTKTNKQKILILAIFCTTGEIWHSKHKLTLKMKIKQTLST